MLEIFYFAILFLILVLVSLDMIDDFKENKKFEKEHGKMEEVSAKNLIIGHKS